MRKRIISILLAIVVMAGILPARIFAAEPIRVLALGDSITAGYGLQNPEKECFTALLGEKYAVTNAAVSGSKVADVAAKLKDDAVAEKAADIIIITVGGNDMMELLYAGIAKIYNAEKGADLKGSDVAGALRGLNVSNMMQNYALLEAAGQVLQEESPAYLMRSQEFATAVADYQRELAAIMHFLKQVNPEVEIIVANQYNPYAEFAGNPLMHPFYAGIEDGVNRMNAALAEGAAAGGYRVADVKAAFQQKHSVENDLYNANPDWKQLSLDFHPGAKGHIVLAETFRKAMEKGTDVVFTDVPSVDDYGMVLDWAMKKGILSSASAGIFRADTACTRGQVVTYLWREAGSPAPKKENMPFVDVSADRDCHDAVMWAVEKGITSGTSATTFSPDAVCARGQIITFLWRLSEVK